MNDSLETTVAYRCTGRGYSHEPMVFRVVRSSPLRNGKRQDILRLVVSSSGLEVAEVFCGMNDVSREAVMLLIANMEVFTQGNISSVADENLIAKAMRGIVKSHVDRVAAGLLLEHGLTLV